MGRRFSKYVAYGWQKRDEFIKWVAEIESRHPGLLVLVTEPVPLAHIQRVYYVREARILRMRAKWLHWMTLDGVPKQRWGGYTHYVRRAPGPKEAVFMVEGLLKQLANQFAWQDEPGSHDMMWQMVADLRSAAETLPQEWDDRSVRGFFGPLTAIAEERIRAKMAFIKDCQWAATLMEQEEAYIKAAIRITSAPSAAFLPDWDAVRAETASSKWRERYGSLRFQGRPPRLLAMPRDDAALLQSSGPRPVRRTSSSTQRTSSRRA